MIKCLLHSLVSIDMKRQGPSTRDRILTAANTLFYNEGIRATSVDAIAEKAGITKKTLYYHFPSKDNLVASYLESRDQPNLEIFAQWFDDCDGTVVDKVAAIFTGVGKGARHPKWKGCGFSGRWPNWPTCPASGRTSWRRSQKKVRSLADRKIHRGRYRQIGGHCTPYRCSDGRNICHPAHAS